jgi:hypothetical protein
VGGNKIMKWSVQNYLIEKINYNTKVKHGKLILSHLLPTAPLLFVVGSMAVSRVILAKAPNAV